MLVKERMSRDLVTVTEETSFQDALRLMRDHKIRRLPVLDKRDRLVGIVVEKDLLYASPSPATSLSVFEMHYLLAKLKIKDVMTRRVITVGEDCPLEEAARIMVDNRIGSLPVMRDDQLVGIITETDIFKVFAEALGAREKGLRINLRVPERKGMLASIAGTIARLGGNIISLATFWGDDPEHREITVKLEGVSRDVLVPELEKIDTTQVLEARQIEAEYQPTILGS
ncbi:MAG: CBS and ACT domain-containing protein [Anaerolineae bacterium]